MVSINQLSQSSQVLYQAEQSIKGYGLQGLKISRVSNVDTLVVKSNFERIKDIISALFIYATGTAQFFKGTVEKNQKDCEQIQAFLHHHFEVINSSVLLLHDKKASQIYQKGYSEKGTEDEKKVIRGFYWRMIEWDNLMFQSKNNKMSYVGLAFNEDWLKEHEFTTRAVIAVEDLSGNFINDYLIDYTKFTTSALIHIVKEKEIKLERLSTAQLIGVSKELSPHCSMKIRYELLSRLSRSDYWPDNAVKQLKNREYCSWLDEYFIGLGYNEYSRSLNPIEGLAKIYDPIKYSINDQADEVKNILGKLIAIYNSNQEK